jgi:Protein of unknown function (DUF2933)
MLPASETRATSVPTNPLRSPTGDDYQAAITAGTTKVTGAHGHTFLGSKRSLVVTLSLAALGAYLLWNHTGHFIYALPFVFLLACPLIHVFGHHHGHHDKPENPK